MLSPAASLFDSCPFCPRYPVLTDVRSIVPALQEERCREALSALLLRLEEEQEIGWLEFIVQEMVGKGGAPGRLAPRCPLCCQPRYDGCSGSSLLCCQHHSVVVASRANAIGVFGVIGKCNQSQSQSQLTVALCHFRSAADLLAEVRAALAVLRDGLSIPLLDPDYVNANLEQLSDLLPGEARPLGAAAFA